MYADKQYPIINNPKNIAIGLCTMNIIYPNITDIGTLVIKDGNDTFVVKPEEYLTNEITSYMGRFNLHNESSKDIYDMNGKVINESKKAVKPIVLKDSIGERVSKMSTGKKAGLAAGTVLGAAALTAGGIATKKLLAKRKAKKEADAQANSIQECMIDIIIDENEFLISEDDMQFLMEACDYELSEDEILDNIEYELNERFKFERGTNSDKGSYKGNAKDKSMLGNYHVWTNGDGSNVGSSARGTHLRKAARYGEVDSLSSINKSRSEKEVMGRHDRETLKIAKHFSKLGLFLPSGIARSINFATPFPTNCRTSSIVLVG